MPALSVDVEEWYHNCWVPEYNDPGPRPGLPDELDILLPRLVEELAVCRARATFFVLGELADRIAGRLRELVTAGHEIACHGWHHTRANELAPDEFLRQIRDSKRRLEDLTGAPVHGFRAPEWSLRTATNPRLRLVAEAGFAYDSSLVASPLAGSSRNPERPTRLRWGNGASLVEVPPLTWGGPLRLPAGGWCGRTAAPGWILSAIRRAGRRGALPLLVVHPWELVDRPCPGLFTGFARFFHDCGRRGFVDRFRSLLAATTWAPIAEQIVVPRRVLDTAAVVAPSAADDGSLVWRAGAVAP
ncbi:MAG: polysaccharide deacetylase family protein [Thermoanaerobaculia bacterium]